jgi:hypothetical protein
MLQQTDTSVVGYGAAGSCLLYSNLSVLRLVLSL